MCLYIFVVYYLCSCVKPKEYQRLVAYLNKVVVVVDDDDDDDDDEIRLHCRLTVQ